jgi:hypothetical protein
MDGDSDDEMLTFLYLYLRNRAKERQQVTRRRFWVHDVLRRRHQLGEFHRLVQELRFDSERFVSLSFILAKNLLVIGFFFLKEIKLS